MEIRNISAAELDDFVSSGSSHYMKTSAWGEFKKRQEKYTPVFLGMFENDVLAATAMVLKKKWHGHTFLYIPEGPCLDYTNTELRIQVFELLQSYAKEQGAQFLRIDPNVLRCERDIEGNRIENGENHEDVTECLVDQGFVHRGYNYAYDGSWTNRYTLITDLSPDMNQVIAGFHKARRTALNRHKVNGVRSRIGGKEDIPSLMEFEAQLAEQDGFKPHSKKFFEDILDCFGDHARLYVTEIHFDEMILGIQNELASKKYAKDPEAKAAKEKELDRARELAGKYGNLTPIACGLFTWYGNGSWDLYTYNDKEMNFIKPVDNLHVFAMTDMKSHGVVNYDLCGFSGVTSKDDPYYGLYSYKRSFNSQFTERIGQFDYILDKKGYDSFNKSWSLRSRIKRKLHSMMYLKKESK